jgi:hypothetical protein
MSLPAILNEVVSVTGTYPFPFTGQVDTPPTNPPTGILPFPPQPVLLPPVGTIGGSATGTTTGTTTTTTGLIGLLTNGNFAIYSDRLLASDNRSVVTDYAAPAIDVPTFRRFVANTTTTGTTTTTGGIGGTFVGTPGNNYNFNTDQFGGTSASAAMVTGAFALVSSALNYWASLNRTGVTPDAYLTQPVGAKVLNFGPHAFKDLTAFNNPDGINAILQWTSVPTSDPNDALSAAAPFNAIGSPNFRNYSRISVSNAIAAIEGTEALQWLIDHDQLKNIDANNNGIITAQELQDFVDNSAKTGNAEAGAMARLLGGTLRSPVSTGTTGVTLAGERPDQPDVLQRRFNFFDFAADGTLNGSVTIPQFQVLAHNLLPLPDAFVINDRQRASANGYLVAPATKRNFADLQHILPTYQFAPVKEGRSGRLTGFRNISPAQFHVARGDVPGTGFPLYTLFNGGLTTRNGVTTAKPANVPAPTPVAATNALSTPVTVSGGAVGGSIAGTPVGQNAQVPVVTPTTTVQGQNGGSPTGANAVLDAFNNVLKSAVSGNSGTGTTTTAAGTTVTSTAVGEPVSLVGTSNIPNPTNVSSTTNQPMTTFAGAPTSTAPTAPATTDATTTQQQHATTPTKAAAHPKVVKHQSFLRRIFG